jgi:hypothetical protein
MQRLPWEGPLWARLVISRYNANPIGIPYNDIGILGYYSIGISAYAYIGIQRY